MEIGNKKSFAVELELDENHGDSWLYGKFCYWIDGDRVGDYELGTSLRDVLFQMKWIVYDCGNRAGGILCKLPPQEVFSKLENSLYESGQPERSDNFPLLNSPARFEIKIPVDVFDQWKAYLLECGDKAMILFKNIDDLDLKVATIAAGIFDNVIKEAYEQLNKLYEKH